MFDAESSQVYRIDGMEGVLGTNLLTMYLSRLVICE
jgi:hypothetical protein